MASKFQKFVGNGSRFGNNSISLNASYSFGFSSSFYRTEKLKDYKRVVLYFSPSDKTVAFSFTNKDEEGSFSVTHGETSGSVSCRSFIIANDLHKKELYGKKSPKKIMDEEFGELWTINLDVK